jgi:transposase InsO family protein
MASSVVIDCLEKGYFPSYGTPTSIVTDNALVFRSKEFKDLCFRSGVEHIYTTPYYPQASLAERVCRNLKSALKIFHHNTQNMWDKDLLHLAFAFNTALHESTQSTPDLLFLGRNIRSRLGSRWDLPSPEVDVKSGEDPALRTRTCEYLKAATRRVARRFNERRSPHQFNVGDTVMFKRNLLSSKPQNITAK